MIGEQNKWKGDGRRGKCRVQNLHVAFNLAISSFNPSTASSKTLFLASISFTVIPMVLTLASCCKYNTVMSILH